MKEQKKEVKLDKGFERVLIYYINAKKQAEEEYAKLTEAEQDILRTVITTSNLGEGNYSFEQKEDGLYLVCEPTMSQEQVPTDEQEDGQKQQPAE